MIDQIAIRRKFGFELVECSTWNDLPREERLGLLTEGRVEFLADGESVEVREALLQLQTLAAA